MRMRSVLVLLFLTVLPSLGAAQEDHRDAVRRADEMRASVQGMLEQPARYHQAGELLVRSVKLRPAGDPESLRSLRLAARLFDYAGDAARAARVAEQAAAVALGQGELLNAGHAYVDAALLQLKRNRAASALALVARAERLAGSPHLSVEARRELLDRLGAERGALGGN